MKSTGGPPTMVGASLFSMHLSFVLISSTKVGQRIINQYSIEEKVFFVGDACHTHSPRGKIRVIQNSHPLTPTRISQPDWD